MSSGRWRSPGAPRNARPWRWNMRDDASRRWIGFAARPIACDFHRCSSRKRAVGLVFRRRYGVCCISPCSCCRWRSIGLPESPVRESRPRGEVWFMDPTTFWNWVSARIDSCGPCFIKRGGSTTSFRELDASAASLGSDPQLMATRTCRSCVTT